MILKKWQGSKYFILIAALSLLSACVSIDNNNSPDNTNNNANKRIISDLPELIRAEPDLTPKQRMSSAIRSLEKGESDKAEVELLEYLKAFPNNRRATSLLSQITTASNDFYPEEFFTLSLRPGQSLSTLAKKYLGSPWEFYALAKYNDIENPSRVNIGTEVKIPLTQLAAQVRKQDKEKLQNPEPKIESKITEAEDQVDESLSEEQVVSEPQSSEEPALSISELISNLESAVQSNNFDDMATLLSDISERSELSETMQSKLTRLKTKGFSEQAKRLEASQPIKASSLFYEAGKLQNESQQTMLAFQSFRAAIVANSTNSEAQKAHDQLQSNIAQQFHREASVLFRQQKLNEAIAKWDVVLNVDPEHSNALAYRTQAIELKQRLEALNN